MGRGRSGNEGKSDASREEIPIENLLHREPLREQVRKLLLDWLLTGELAAGSDISEKALAEKLGISRTPLREALLKLEYEGFLSSEPGKGFSVRPFDPDGAEDLYRLAGKLEAEALRAAGVPDAGRLDELERLDEERRMNEEEHAAEKAVVVDDRWHRRLVSECPNQVLLEVVELVKTRLIRYEYLFADDYHRLGQEGLSEHGLIVEALREDDLDRACEILEAHFERGARERPDWLREMESLSAATGGSGGRG